MSDRTLMPLLRKDLHSAATGYGSVLGEEGVEVYCCFFVRNKLLLPLQNSPDCNGKPAKGWAVRRADLK